MTIEAQSRRSDLDAERRAIAWDGICRQLRLLSARHKLQ